MPIKRIRFAFTLIETVLAIFVITLLGGLIAYKSKTLIDVYRFENQMSRFLNELNHTQTLAISIGSDLEVVLQNGPKGLEFYRKTDEPLKGAVAISFSKKPILFSHLQTDYDQVIEFSPKGGYGPNPVVAKKKGFP
ncbi:MAG: hypothetical protein WDZ28_04905 [Simkaniaceae bacterium]